MLQFEIHFTCLLIYLLSQHPTMSNHPSLPTLLTQLEETNLLQRLEEMDTAYQFQHSLTRDSAYGSLLRKQRRDLHRRVAECYEQLYPNRLEEFAAQLAYHFDEAGEPRAWRYYRLAGDAAFRLYANTEAIAYYESALRTAALVSEAADIAEADLLHLHQRRGRAMELLGRFDDALTNYESLENHGREHDQPSLVLAGLVEQCQLRSTPNPLFDGDKAGALAAEALTLAQSLNDQAAEARIYWSLLNVGRFTTGKLEQAREYGERALVLTRRLDLADLHAYTLNDLADVYLMVGRPSRARELLDEAGALFRELGNLPMLADNLASRSGYEVFVGHDDEAIALSDESYTISQSIANIWGQSYSRSLIGYVYWDRGESQHAIALTETSIRQAREVGFVAAETFSGALLGLIYGDLGDHERGRAAVDQGWKAVLGSMSAFAPALLAVRARLSIWHGDLAAAETAVQSLLGEEQSPNPFMVIFYRGVPAQLALAQSRFDDALQHTEDDLATLAELGITRTIPEIQLLRAQALLGLGRLAEARPELLAAHEGALRTQQRRVLWRIQAALATLEATEGRQVEAESLHRQARATVSIIASNITDPDLAASFLSRPQIAAVMQP